jgi:hypothetical protein
LAVPVLFVGHSGFAGVPLEWAAETTSPRAAALDPRDGDLVAGCRESDAALGVVASRLARHELAASDVEELTYALRAAGEPHVWPRAIALEGPVVDRAAAKSHIDKWLAPFRHRGPLRCALASATAGGKQTLAAVVVEARADLAPVPVVVRPASWVDVDARILVPATGAKVIVLGPSGPPRTVPTSVGAGHVRARVNLDRPGPWQLQVVLDGEGGPRPVLEALVFAGVKPPPAPSLVRAPGEEADTGGDEIDSLAEMIAAARASEGLASLHPSGALDRLARAHAERMMHAAELGHDVGDGDVRRRVEEAGIDAAQIGENVAHASSLPLAHRALWSSPSHRDNLLGRRFMRVGLGVAHDPDGSVWVTELFAGN